MNSLKVSSLNDTHTRTTQGHVIKQRVFTKGSVQRGIAGIAHALQWCVCVVCRFGCWLAGSHPSVLQAPLPQTPDAGEELQHQGQVRTTQGIGSTDGGEDDDECLFLFSLPPQGAGGNSAETGSFGARGRLCELNYVTYCDAHTYMHAHTNPLWRFTQMHAYTCLTDL